MQGRASNEIPFQTVGYLDLKALASYSCCSIRWLRSRLHDKANPLPYYQVDGGKILVNAEEFDRWMQSFRSRPSDGVEQVIEDVLSKFLHA